MSNHISTKRYTFALYIGAMVFNMCVNLTGSVLNNIMDDYNIDLNSGGLMACFQYVGGIVAILVFSRFADRFKKPFILMVGFSVAAISLFITGGMLPFAAFVAVYMIYGASLGILDASNNAAVTDLYPHNMKTALSILHGVFGMGAMMIPLITAAVGTSNWGGIYRGVAVVIAIIVVFQIAMYTADKKAVDSFYIRADGQDAGGSANTFFSDKDVWFAVVSMMFFGLSQGGLITWIVKYNTDMFPTVGDFGWALGLSVYWVGATLCRLGMGILPMFAKWDSRKLIVYGGILAGLALIIGIVSGDYYIFMSCVFAFGILSGATIPRIVGLMNGWYPKNTGLSSSLSFTALYVGFALAAIFMGVIAASLGISRMMVFPAMAAVLSGAAAIPITKQR